uniref:Uncharacterized protein n=1 Tax=Anguilla anguilla TaxID=7936 RepID=A0A0E9RDS7_ANGAN
MYASHTTVLHTEGYRYALYERIEAVFSVYTVREAGQLCSLAG